MSTKRLSKLPAKTYAGFGFSMLDMAVKESFAERCSKDDLEVLRREFERDGTISCVYCGAADATRWDHYYPVSRGGDTSLGNLVPACASCDDSKQNKTIEEWRDSKSKKRPSPERAKQILKFVAKHQKHHQYKPREFESKLSADQVAVYAEFQNLSGKLRRFLIKQGVIAK